MMAALLTAVGMLAVLWTVGLSVRARARRTPEADHGGRRYRYTQGAIDAPDGTRLLTYDQAAAVKAARAAKKVSARGRRWARPRGQRPVTISVTPFRRAR